MTAVRNSDAFRDEYSLLDKAGCGLALIRTREPARAEDAIRTWAFGNRRPYRKWNVISGLMTFSHLDAAEAPKVAPGLAALDAVLRGIGGWPSPTGAAPANTADRANRNNPFCVEAVFSFVWPHPFMGKNMPVNLAMISDLAAICSECDYRIALIVPHEYEIPTELSEVLTVMSFDTPSRDELTNTYQSVANAGRQPLQLSDEDQKVVLNTLAGMTETEAADALARAVASNAALLPRIPLAKFMPKLIAVKTESIRKSDCLEIQPVTDMSNVGGLDLLKSWVALRKNAFGDTARAAGVDKPRGLMLAGPPGSGKSLAAKAIASELGTALIKFDLSRVYAGLVGQSEARVRAALKTLEGVAPVTVLLDELDKSVSSGNSSGNDGGVATRVLGTLLNFMQESTAEIFWVFTANRTANLPSELVRKGRLDEVFCVSMPSSTERLDILSIHLRKRKEDPNKIEGLADFAERAAGYVGAELEAAVSSAKLTAFANKTKVTVAMLDDQLRSSKPLSEAFKDDFDAMKMWAEQNARPASSTQNTGGTPVARPRVRGAPGTRNMRMDNAESAAPSRYED